MKVAAIFHNGREIERFPLNKPTVFIGRSPTCDVILRAKHVKAVHFVVDWMGEGEFDPDTGFWSIVDISSQGGKESSSGEGVILGPEGAQFANFEFRASKDDLAESNLRRGVLKRNIESDIDLVRTRSEEGTCLEVIGIRNSLESVESVNHYSCELKGPVTHAVKNLPEMRFNFADSHHGFLDPGGLPSDVQILNKNELLVGEGRTKARIEISEKDLLIVKSLDYDYYLRLVPKIKVIQSKEFRFDPTLLTLILIILFLFLLSFVVPNLPVLAEKEPDLARIAYVEVPEIPPPPVIPEPVKAEVPPPEVTEEVMPEESPKEPVPEVKEVPKPKPKPKAEPKPEPKLELKVKGKIKQEKTSIPVKKGVEKSAGDIAKVEAAQAKARVQRQMGFLNLVKKGSGTGSKNKVNASEVLGQMESGTNDVSAAKHIVPLSRPGSISARPRSGDGGTETDSQSKNRLEAAHSDLKSFAETGKAGKAISKSGGSVLEGGLPSGAIGGLGAGAVVGFDDGVTTEVTGGLSRDAVRTAIREYQIQIRGCYERALGDTNQKGLAGKMTFFWKISAQGDVSDTKLTFSDLQNPKFENCVKRIIDRIIFKKASNSQATYVKYPFIFHSKK